MLSNEGKNFMKRYRSLCFITLFLVLFVSAVSAGAKKEEAFSWNLALQNAKTGDLIPFSAPIHSWNGEKFRLIIEPGADFFCYVVSEGPNGEDVSVLYAGRLKAGETWFSPVLELQDPKGSESIFIITSGSEQKALGQKIAALNRGSTTSQRALMNEVFSLRGEISKFREIPEKPIFMGGAARGSPDRNQGVEYSGSSAYIKSISIEH